MIHKRSLAAVALFAAVVGAACAQLDPVSPSKSSQVGKTSSHDTSTVDPGPSTPVTPPAVDTGGPAYHGTVALTGRAVALRHAPAGSIGDTLLYLPIAGATVTATANATGTVTATGTTGSDGSFSFSLPAGPYRISAHPLAGSGAIDGSILVFAGQPAVYVQLILPSAP